MRKSEEKIRRKSKEQIRNILVDVYNRKERSIEINQWLSILIWYPSFVKFLY